MEEVEFADVKKTQNQKNNVYHVLQRKTKPNRTNFELKKCNHHKSIFHPPPNHAMNAREKNNRREENFLFGSFCDKKITEHLPCARYQTQYFKCAFELYFKKTLTRARLSALTSFNSILKCKQAHYLRCFVIRGNKGKEGGKSSRRQNYAHVTLRQNFTLQ